MITFLQLTPIQIFQFFKGHILHIKQRTRHLTYKNITAASSIRKVLQTEQNLEKPQIFKCCFFALYRISDSFFKPIFHKMERSNLAEYKSTITSLILEPQPDNFRNYFKKKKISGDQKTRRHYSHV